MKEYHLFYAPHINKDNCLPDDEAGHAVRVLRMREGDRLQATDGCGHFYDCTITVASQKHCEVHIDRQYDGVRPWRGNIRLAVAPTKNMDRMEWLAEKATEIGVDTITFLDCKNSERRVIKPERIERIVVSATKQSHKAWKPTVEPLTDFKSFIATPFEGQKFIAHCHDMSVPNDLPSSANSKSDEDKPKFLADIAADESDALILIGPEGDFTREEVAAALRAGFVPVSLGESRLRTETAALVAVHILNISKRVRC